MANFGGNLFLLSLLHFVVDWGLQSHSESLRKSHDHKVRARHCTVYTLGVGFARIIEFPSYFSGSLDYSICWLTHSVKKSRSFYFHEGTNPKKLDSLEALHLEYLRYSQACIDVMIERRTFHIPLKDLNSTFQDPTELSSNIRTACQRQASAVVSTWNASRYASKLKSKIWHLYKTKEIDECTKIALCTIGKYGVNRPTKSVSQEDLDLYWALLLDSSNPPKASERLPIRTTIHTGRIAEVQRKLSSLWLRVSVLEKGKTLRIPLKSNPHIQSTKELTNGCQIRKDKLGRWLVEALEEKDYPEPVAPKGAPRLGVDVGLNCLAATSDGRIYGTKAKPRFDYLYGKIKSIRANRQRQNLKENSKKLDRLEAKLSGFIRTETGRISNTLVKSFPGHVFVIEDLDLRGCKGQKRFAYKALQSSLEKKAPTVKVNPAYTSQACPACGHVSRRNRSGIRFRCTSCGNKLHADSVGSINLLGRSEDSKIKITTSVSEVKTLLSQRYFSRRNPKKRTVPQVGSIGCELASLSSMLGVS